MFISLLPLRGDDMIVHCAAHFTATLTVRQRRIRRRRHERKDRKVAEASRRSTLTKDASLALGVVRPTLERFGQRRLKATELNKLAPYAMAYFGEKRVSARSADVGYAVRIG